MKNLWDHPSIEFQWNAGYLNSVQVKQSSDARLLVPDFPPFELSIAGKINGIWPSVVTGTTDIPLQMNWLGIEEKESVYTMSYEHPELKIKVEVEWALDSSMKVFRSITKVKNYSQEDYVLTHLSSGMMNGIAPSGIRHWADPEKIIVHYCRSSWKREGQWRKGSLEDLGLFPVAEPLSPRGAIHFSSVGSFSTGKAVPVIIIEDQETGQTWFAQIESPASWHLEIGYRGTETKGALYLLADSANETHGGWNYCLKPGETYISTPVAMGVCEGGFEEAIEALVCYRRKYCVPKPAWKGEVPLVFNDYMNCWWGDPLIERLIPLIDKASLVGAEVFCIDAGWFGDRGQDWNLGLGDWMPGESRFMPGGLRGVVEQIVKAKMIPGIWLELEVCGEKAALANRPDSWFVRRYGKRVGGGDRWFLDFKNQEVVSYLFQVVDRLVSMGFGYIKHDYNSCIGVGVQNDSYGVSEGLRQHLDAVLCFFDSVRQRYPHLIIENCGSGGMRHDYGTLSHFHLQSFSDVEVYTQCPAVLMGCLANILPEQLGIWAYPIPYSYPDYLANPHGDRTLDKAISSTTEEETIFNMINGLCGNLYLSGRIDQANTSHLKLIQEGITVYKNVRRHLRESTPFWPLGFASISGKNQWACVGHRSLIDDHITLAVWRLDSGDCYLTIPIVKFRGKEIKIEQIYPSNPERIMRYSWNRNQGEFTVRFPQSYTARYFTIREL